MAIGLYGSGFGALIAFPLDLLFFFSGFIRCEDVTNLSFLYTGHVRFA